MSVETNPLIGPDKLKERSEGKQEPKWLTDLRLDALNKVESLELPKPDKTKIHNWDFTSFTQELREPKEISSLDELSSDIQQFVDEEATGNSLLIQDNGKTIFQTNAAELADKGVVFCDFATAVKEHGDLVKKYLLTEAVSADENKLTAMHAALMEGGAFIYVPKNVNVEVPLQAVYAVSDEKAGLFNHVLIVAEDNSSVTYVENYTGYGSGASVANLVAEVYVGAGARVSFGGVDTLNEDATTYVVRRAHVERDGRIDWALGQMNDGDTVAENITYLVGDGSYADAKLVSVGTGEQKQNFTTLIKHYGKHSEGYILKHGVMTERALGIFNGISKIEKAATKAHGEQTERILMLGERARGDANPILLIDEDDVTAGHAASVGRIDPLQMFYLMSRGISRAEAERLVIHGFLEPVVSQLPVESVRKQMKTVIERKAKR
ncbi:Fe-S cluster assembly protein SufD [Shouchella clausii]|jgi:Fe-S cluster assembly protein SufD|uniref:Fe-S cluster assembly protein SufD n=1 Tax=Shouchella clausii TaxID=79880 RepID=A0A268S1K5_SHOCL|nr:Fe-S cluster assembly protein SufD [Shouchella clausii]PAD41300.1 Fe-S cluster assembly protein SufD [Bacillus sp. 7520-S]MBU8597991.1 Fe-S cluster assembly protein SufD [Shouchella clausii]MCM3547700.1 Fe-S cluster assembly protein SufD [Shouchella clausii]MCY1105370.1 Fe-S cluster assembly protein SufD [Shouchella clausii]MEB5481897.1 Fe-S cluster assembly protein SufD [Shouchella clausii]